MTDFLDSADDILGLDFGEVVAEEEAQAVDAPIQAEAVVTEAAEAAKEVEKTEDGAEPKISFTLEEDKGEEDDPISLFALELGFSKEQAEGIKTVRELRELTANEIKKFSNSDEIERPDLSTYDQLIKADLEDEDTILDLARQRMVQTGISDPDKLIAKLEDDELLKLAEEMQKSAVAQRSAAVQKYNKAIEDKERERLDKINEIKAKEEAFENSFIEACKTKQVTLDGFEINESYARRVLDIRRNPEKYGFIKDLDDPQKMVDMITAGSSDRLVAHVRGQLNDLRRTKAESEFVKRRFEDKIDLKVDMAKNGGAQKVSGDDTEVESADDLNNLNL